MITSNLTSSVVGATATLWDRVLWLIPNLILAVLVVIIGWMISVILGKIAEKVLHKLNINKAVEGLGLNKALADIHLGSDIAGFVGAAIKWFFAIAFFLAAADILRLNQVTDFLNRVLLYIPNIIAAVLILAAGMILALFFSCRVSFLI